MLPELSSLTPFPVVQNAGECFHWVQVVAGVACLVLSGCGESQSTVAGSVTFDGQPVASGMVTFVSSDGPLARAGAVISNGAFRTQLAPGNYKVELNAQKVTGKRRQKGFDGKDEEVELTAELFPPKYNAQTTLTAKVERGENKLQFDVTSAN